MIFAFAVIVLLFAGLAFRIGWIQIVATDIYASRAAETQVKDELIPARRGDILDRNMKELAVSTSKYTLFIRLKPPKGMTMDPKDHKQQLKSVTELLSETLGISKKTIETKTSTSDNSRVKVATGVNKDQMDIILQALTDRKLNILEVEENPSRTYPLGSFASHVLGSINKDGHGQGGIELEYDDYLSGTAGRRIVNTDAKNNPLPGGEKANYDKQDGYSVVLTIDEPIQYYVEDVLKKSFNKLKPKNIRAIVMNPKNGDVLAMAAYPNFDPNDASTPVDPEAKKEFAKMSDKEQSEYLSAMWRNPVVSDLYEPGSVFKLVTASSALEASAATLNSNYDCRGIYQVEDREIHCHVFPAAHGYQTLTEAIGNSCNPAMIQIIQHMGYDKFSQYLDLYGMTAKTGIDLPAEAAPLTQNKQTAGPVGLATMSFGMGLNITPVEMVSAIASIGNDGKYMQPRVVKALADDEGNIVKEFQSKVVRQVISKQTARETMDIMTYVTEEAGGQIAQVPGYKIGSKTGTSQKLVDGEYSKDHIVGSMVAMAPMDDPQFVVLVVVDDPEEGGFGNTTAGPAVHDILEELLRYYNVKPQFTDSELAKMAEKQKTVPDVTGLIASDAQGILLGEELVYNIQGADKSTDFKVKDQYPKAGEKIKKGETVYLYAQ
ncbi:MAG: PASTA domain-containing protein [Clostridiales Family XIII bacterium]|nr:PASTA domain-containing protein [Clostridiales Family XIII bacterium]